MQDKTAIQQHLLMFRANLRINLRNLHNSNKINQVKLTKIKNNSLRQVIL